MKKVYDDIGFNQLSRGNEYHYAQAKRVYVDRAFGGDIRHFNIDVDIAAGT
jgi:hypothetical protein